MMGSVGVGKTSNLALLAWGIAKFLCTLSRFISVGDLFDLFFRNDVEKIEELRKCPILFLDDLGREYTTDFPLSRFENFVEYRYSNLLPSFVTTNLSFGDLQKKEGWERIVDRMKDTKWMRKLTIAGSSLRGKEIDENAH